MSTTTIRKILGKRQLHSVAPAASLHQAAKVMADNGVGALAVIDGETLLGILTERDIVFRAVGRGLPVDDTTAADVMTADPVTVDIDDAISDALAAKLGDAFRHLPVLEDGRVVGLLSYRDIPPEYVMMFEHFREMSTARADDRV
ncbi:MAG: CBS domain-containing protein [Paracoccaceae bacterium]|nr:CBS domain-containing protein [Paracoccaceae bacterium]